MLLACSRYELARERSRVYRPRATLCGKAAWNLTLINKEKNKKKKEKEKENRFYRPRSARFPRRRWSVDVAIARCARPWLIVDLLLEIYEVSSVSDWLTAHERWGGDGGKGEAGAGTIRKLYLGNALTLSREPIVFTPSSHCAILRINLLLSFISSSFANVSSPPPRVLVAPSLSLSLSP